MSGVLVFSGEGSVCPGLHIRGEVCWVAVITGRARHLFCTYPGALVQEHQTSVAMSSQRQRHRQLTHSEDIARPCVRTKTRVLTGELAWPISRRPG